MMTAFDEATAASRLSEGIYAARADPRFAIVVAPGGSAQSGTVGAAVNGGVLMATVLRAVLDCAPNPHPVATSANFLRVPHLGPAEIRVSWLKHGKTASAARATLLQDGEPVLETTITTGTLPPPPVTARPDAVAGADASGEDSGPTAASAPDAGDPKASAPEAGRVDWQSLTWTGSAPAFPDIADCIDLGQWPGTAGPDGTAGYAAHVDVRLDPVGTGWRGGSPSGMPEMRGYVGLREPRDPDALLLALAVDALPPVVFGLGATGWAPTVELTWHMRGVPVPGPLRVACRARHVSGGWFDEEAEVWDAAGRLVAQSRQLARVGRGPVRPVVDSRAADGRVAAAAT
jgi:acyl-coenzyme A thioesterase PaaI-like protein